MRLYKFRKSWGGRSALTPDGRGKNLPKGEDRWIFDRPIEVVANDGPRLGASSVDILAAIESRGYFLWPSGGASTS